MNFGGITHALKGINGNFEINRLVGGLGGLVYIICANVFVGYEVFWQGKPFDITAYCLAFPSGIAAIVAGTAGAVSWKDNGVASAKITEQTGTIPAKPPEVVVAPAAPARPTPLVPHPAPVVEPAVL